MADDLYDVPSRSLNKKEEPILEEEHSGKIVPQKSGIGGFFRKLVSNEDASSIVKIFSNSMIDAVSDSIDEITGNLVHRAKTELYGTENYARGSRRYSNGGGDRYGSYSKYYDDRRNNNRPSGRISTKDSSGQVHTAEFKEVKWKYDQVLFDSRAFGGKRQAEMAAWRVIKKLDDQISDADCEVISVADFFRYCKEEMPDNPFISTEFTDESIGWDGKYTGYFEALEPQAVMNGYIIELPKPIRLN